MERFNRRSLEDIDKELQKNYKKYISDTWDECTKNGLQVRLIINFDKGRVTSIQNQAIIIGSSVLDFYS